MRPGTSGSNVALNFLAKIGAPVGGAPAAAPSIISSVRPGALPLSKEWTFRRPSSTHPPSELGLELNKHCCVKNVKPGSIADEAHVTRGLVLCEVNGHRIRTEAEFIAQASRHVECSMLFFEDEPVTEVLMKIGSAKAGADGYYDEPDLGELYKQNPQRYGFIALDHPLHRHFQARAEETRATRNELDALEREEEEEEQRKERERQSQLEKQMATLDGLLDSSDGEGDDAPAPDASAAAAPPADSTSMFADDAQDAAPPAAPSASETAPNSRPTSTAPEAADADLIRAILGGAPPPPPAAPPVAPIRIDPMPMPAGNDPNAPLPWQGPKPEPPAGPPPAHVLLDPSDDVPPVTLTPPERDAQVRSIIERRKAGKKGRPARDRETVGRTPPPQHAGAKQPANAPAPGMRGPHGSPLPPGVVPYGYPYPPPGGWPMPPPGGWPMPGYPPMPGVAPGPAPSDSQKPRGDKDKDRERESRESREKRERRDKRGRGDAEKDAQKKEKKEHRERRDKKASRSEGRGAGGE